MTVRADPSQITIADKLNVTIEVVATNGVEVRMPSFGEKLNDFEIVDFHERSAVPQNGSRRWTQQYVLQAFLSGDLEVPAITAGFTDRRDPARAVEGEIACEPIEVKVASLLAGEFDPTRFRDIKGTVELPLHRGRAWLWWSLGAAGGLVLLGLAVWLLGRRSRRAAVPAPLPPHEWAFFALQRLEEDRLIEAGRVQEFYFRLSGIVREYIERRFGLMAPERTTPEFLAEVQASADLSGVHKRLLGEFLQAADMVKFARYEPAAAEVLEALNTARAFVDQTAPTACGSPVTPAQNRPQTATVPEEVPA